MMKRDTAVLVLILASCQTVIGRIRRAGLGKNCARTGACAGAPAGGTLATRLRSFWQVVFITVLQPVVEFYFLRTFEQLTGITPHQYVRRTRLREAASRLVAETEKVLDVALDCGFGDVSNFNRAFRTEFGVSPRVFRRTSR
jgi:Helix-turn-helix domain